MTKVTNNQQEPPSWTGNAEGVLFVWGGFFASLVEAKILLWGSSIMEDSTIPETTASDVDDELSTPPPPSLHLCSFISLRCPLNQSKARWGGSPAQTERKKLGAVIK